MNIIFAFVLSAWFLPTALPQESSSGSDRHIRAVQFHLEQELNQSLKTFEAHFPDHIGIERLLDDSKQADICALIQQAFVDIVKCGCTFAVAKVKFHCRSAGRIELALGLSGIPKYTGALDYSRPKRGIQANANICLLKTRLNGTKVGNLCVGGSLCSLKGKPSVCGCHASLGKNRTCSCASCDLFGVKVTCDGLPIPDICIPLPFVRSTDPLPNSIQGVGSL